MRRVWGLLAATLLAGCAAAPVAAPSSSGPVSAVLSAAGTTKLRVTVPELGSGGGSASTAESASTAQSSDSTATFGLELVNCEGCVVLATHTAVVPGFSAALVLSDGRAVLLSLDPAGAVIGVLNVPYGVTFPTPAGGELACATGRCVVVGAQADGRAILSAFELSAAGSWRDLSGSTGFVSATSRGSAVPLEDSVGVAVQVSDSATTVWAVLGFDGSTFTVLGCAPDADGVDLTVLSPERCLS